ncbi:MAG TPA: MBL fold metallo-hydrolase [Candidatus Acidoferrum sp.]|nr:MBL fold metallo-hydrolase [Candidatus Acidoferrum sp.]
MIQVYPGIFQTQIPLLGNPLKELNCFIVKGEDRSLVVDTGFNQPEGRKLLLDSLQELGCPIERTDVFITHLHSDHAGLTGAVKNEKNKAYASAYDADAINRPFREKDKGDVPLAMRMSDEMGFPKNPEERLETTSHPGIKNRSEREIDFTVVKEGDRLDYGDFHFEVIDIAGHTPGQVGLYDREKKVMFCGDHILGKITPNITFWSFDLDSLGQYLQNLKKVRNMEVDHLFSAHRYLVDDHRARIDALFAHHARRLDEVRSVISKAPTSPYDTAAQMTWDFAGGVFENFPVAQKWFAAGEAMSHLEHLYHTGEATRTGGEGEALLYAMKR